MRTRNPSPRTWSRWLMPAAVSTVLLGCPNQELAPLTPCTVSGVSLEVPQSGVDKVDILFMIDNSGSMSEEQKKLAEVLDDMVRVLTTGNKSGMASPPGMKPEFPPVQSLHIGVISSDMGVNGAPALLSCGDKSFVPDDPSPQMSGMRVIKPFGDDGILQTSTAVAVKGIFAPPPGNPTGDPIQVVPGDQNCGSVTFPPGQRFIDFVNGVTDPNVTAQQFGCVAKLGRNGCGLEQHLESALKALTPIDSDVKFSQVNYGGQASPNGHGTAKKMGNPSGPNGNFLREDSILAIVFVADEEDCSIPDGSRAIFDSNSTAIPGEINVRCGLPENQKFLHSVTDRYVAGLRALKPAAYQDRIIVASIVGVPVRENTQAPMGVTSGAANIDKILARDDMKFKTQRNAAGTADEPVPTCISAKGDGSAAPARRFLELTKAFNENGVVTSICEDEYGSALQVIIDKIAAQLTGACLPRKLSADAAGKVACDVVEIKAEGSMAGCDASKGRVERLPNRKVNGKERVVCRMQQVPGGQGAEGWYYDDSSKEVQEQCRKNPQRIAFTNNANPDPGAQAKFECFQPVASGVDADDRGRDAINLNCKQDPLNPSAPFGDDVCAGRAVNGAPLICVNDSCQLSCNKESECPLGWLCEPTPDNARRYCINPTCPPASQ